MLKKTAYMFVLATLSFVTQAKTPENGAQVKPTGQRTIPGEDKGSVVSLSLGDMSFLLPAAANPRVYRGLPDDVGGILLFYSLPSGKPFKLAQQSPEAKDVNGYSLGEFLIEITRNEQAAERFGLKYVAVGEVLGRVHFDKLSKVESEGFEVYSKGGDKKQAIYIVNNSGDEKYPLQNFALCGSPLHEPNTINDNCSIKILLKKNLTISARFNQYYLDKLPEIYALLLEIYTSSVERDA